MISGDYEGVGWDCPPGEERAMAIENAVDVHKSIDALHRQGSSAEE